MTASSPATSRSRGLWLLVAALLGSLSWVAWVFSADEPQASTASSRRVRCVFAVDEELHYRVQYAASFHLSRTAGPMTRALQQAKLPKNISLQLGLKVNQVSEAWAELRLVVSDLKVQPPAQTRQGTDGAADMIGLLRVDRQCRVVGLAHDVASKSSYVPFVRSLVLGLGFELHDERVYDRTEKDAAGTVVVRYGRKGDHTLIRRPLRYLKSPGAPRVEAVGGATEVRLGAGPWFAKRHTQAQLRWLEDNRELARAKIELTAERVAPTSSALWPKDDAFKAISWSWKDQPKPTEPAAATWPGLKGMAAEAAGAELMRLQGPGKAPSPAALAFIKAWILANPGGDRALIDALARGLIPAEARGLLVSAFVHLDGLVGRRALVYMHSHKDLDPASRAVAAMGLGQLKESGPEVVETLAKAARRDMDNDKDLVGNASALALGALAHKQQSINPELGLAAEKVIRERLSLPEVEAQREALFAISNTSGDHFVEEVMPYTQHNDPSLRAAAAAALRTHKGTPELYGAWLATEADREVLHAIGSAVRARVGIGQKLDVATRNGLVGAIGKTSELQVKAQLISALGAASKDDPAAKAALIQAFQTETSPRAKALYGTYATAAELMPDQP